MKKIASFFIPVLLLGTIAISAGTGADGFEVHLNNKLLLRHYFNSAVMLKDIDLTGAKATDRLSIRYFSCHNVVENNSGRKITLRDTQGKIVYEWTFKDGDEAMVIPVKELLAVQKDNSSKLILYYASEGLTGGQKLAALATSKQTAFVAPSK